ncbi:hypothetical protein PHAVU_003G243600 [Phaseolus vulgaris]|uniref:Uncharacterized protein n=1 Tax=Phaseolus vulgaris TaxID=3885 RepID=V7CG70_PHAVU|nr:hypothetical protein PHAVU_003G243600g [Phaseolus vulgaris]ESW27916.1 hypothetical protein PHAVU_003G243600g [Phaseolus vulgaris]
MTAKNAEKQISSEPHWAFCYTMLHKVSRSFALVIQQLGTDLRNALRNIFGLVNVKYKPFQLILRRLAQVALEGELEMADNKATFLQNLCDELYDVKLLRCFNNIGYDADIQKSVRKTTHGLRLTREIVVSNASKAVSIGY